MRKLEQKVEKEAHGERTRIRNRIQERNATQTKERSQDKVRICRSKGLMAPSGQSRTGLSGPKPAGSPRGLGWHPQHLRAGSVAAQGQEAKPPQFKVWTQGQEGEPTQTRKEGVYTHFPRLCLCVCVSLSLSSLHSLAKFQLH